MYYQDRMKRAAAIAIFTAVLATPAFALELADAKSSGAVGETRSGYIGAVKSSSEIDALVADINAKRRAHYQEIADKNNISREAVEARAGQKAIEKSESGAYIDIGNGWESKK